MIAGILALVLLIMVILVNTTDLRSVLWLRLLFGVSALNFTLRAAIPLILGALDAGASRMQFDSGVAADIIQIIQALVLIFVAAPIIIRSLFRLPKPSEEIDATPLSTGWTS